MKTRLIDFPDYEIDTETGDVFRATGWVSGRWKTLRGQGMKMKRRYNREGTPGYMFSVRGKYHFCSQGRLLASVRLGVSVHSLPRSVAFRHDGSVTTWREVTIQGQRCASSRYAVTLADIEETENDLIAYKAAYNGDFSLLLERIEAVRPNIKERMRKKTGYCAMLIDDGWSEAVDHLIKQIRTHRGNVVANLRVYLCKLAIGLCRQAHNRAIRTLQYNENINH